MRRAHLLVVIVGVVALTLGEDKHSSASTPDTSTMYSGKVTNAARLKIGLLPGQREYNVLGWEVRRVAEV